jgi:uncharacterized membrane protein
MAVMVLRQVQLPNYHQQNSEKQKRAEIKKTEMEDERMNIVTYSLFAYGLTAVISFLVMGVVVLISKTLNNNNAEQEIE